MKTNFLVGGILILGCLLFLFYWLYFYNGEKSDCNTSVGGVAPACCRILIANSPLCYSQEIMGWDGRICPKGGGCTWKQTGIKDGCFNGKDSALAGSPWDGTNGNPGPDTEFICTNTSP